ncbi:hypothetical protein QJQ45_025610 [Haematococcus lacustris]|nr:hypothetical protein QJQ45_025610 [Haematococcus lacustris]
MLVVILVALLAPWGSQAYTYPLVDLPGSTVTCPAPTPYLGPDGRPLDPMSLIVPSLSFLESSGLDRECLGSVMEGLSSCIGDIPIREGCCSAGCATALNTFLSVEGGECLPQVGAALCRNNEIANMLRPMHFNAYKRCVTGMLLSCADVYQGPPPPPTPSPSLSPSPSPGFIDRVQGFTDRVQGFIDRAQGFIDRAQALKLADQPLQPVGRGAHQGQVISIHEVGDRDRMVRTMLLVLVAALLAPWGSQAYPLVDDGTVTCPAPTPYLGPDGRPLDPMSLIEPSLSFLDSSGLDAQCLGAIVGGLPTCIQDIVIQDGCCSAGCATALNTFLSVEGGRCLPQLISALCGDNQIVKMLRPMQFNAFMRCVTGTLLSCADFYPGPPPPPPSPRRATISVSRRPCHCHVASSQATYVSRLTLIS